METPKTNTLRAHRQRLKDAGEKAYTFEIEPQQIERLCGTLAAHLKNAGYLGISPARNREVLETIIHLLFEAQDQRPMFHVEGTELPLCWNSPRDWSKDFIKYEWGHLISRNQNAAKAQRLENLGLYSARCNQHIQTSLDVPELMVYGGIIAQRVSLVLTSRRKLFTTQHWQNVVAQLGPAPQS